MTNFILQHNTKNYQRFIARLSKVCCNNRQYICGFNIKHETNNEYYLKKEISQNVENQENEEKKKQDRNANETETTLDTAMMSSVVAQSISSITVEQSYFTSQISKDEDVMPDKLSM